MNGVEVQTLRLARLELPDFHPEAPGTDTIHGFLVRDGADCILVDTGVGDGNEHIDRLYRPRGHDLAAALPKAGASVGAITAVVNTHLHFDHCGNNALFAGVPIYVQRAELEASRERLYTVPGWVDFPGARYEQIQGRHAISEHLELIPTPGHTPGHQSLLIHSEGSLAVIVAQAAYTAAEFEEFVGSAKPHDEKREAFLDSNASWSREAYVESLAMLAALDPRRAYFSHDPTVWESSR